MQVTKGTWRMREQCVPGSLSSSHAREPGNEARLLPECSAGYLELRRLKLKQTWRVGINVHYVEKDPYTIRVFFM